MDTVSVRCCIAGAGPAGVILGLLLARAGVEVLVLEKHADFLRDFRGDTLHPSTLEVMHELGLLQKLLHLPHQKVSQINALFGDLALTVADFNHLQTQCRFIALMPQWDFLNFLTLEAARYPTFHLRMQSEVTGLIEEKKCVTGLNAISSGRPLSVRTNLVVGADGRHSVVRTQANLKVQDFGAPMDVLWFKLTRQSGDPKDPVARFDTGRVFIMLNRGEYWQCGFVISKGSLGQIRERGLPALRDDIVKLAPFVSDRVGKLQDWEEIKLLTVQVDRLRQWFRPGLLCLGDAAHAMSPVGGVGINLAIQDAVAAANLLAGPLRSNRLITEDLRRVQRRREWPTRLTQQVQLSIQNRVISRVLRDDSSLSPPFLIQLLARFPFLRRLPARLIGIGFCPEHVSTPCATELR
ncbi:MAG: FAD-dependent oxidoreductase [Nitrosomonadaceae bacterium]|jgi:2-polyprenyl-6-methoxyphenol hydroxylase-like FAD-dependent oxidoreductase